MVVMGAHLAGVMQAKAGSEVWAVLLAVGVVSVFALAWIFNGVARRARIRLAHELGLTRDEENNLRGDIAGFAVALVSFQTEAEQRKNRQVKTRITVSGGLPTDIHLGRAGLIASVSDRSLASVAGHDVDIGSSRFDERFVIKGEPRALFALLDLEVRERFASAIDGGWTFQNGAWSFEIFGMPGEAKSKLAIKEGVELATWLRERADRDLLPRMLERIHFDPEPGVRRRALGSLAAEGGQRDPTVMALFEELRDDADPEVRFLAAKGREDADALIAMALHPTLDTALRIGALGVLAAMVEPRFMTVLSTLMLAPERPAVELRRAAIGMLGPFGAEAEALAIDALADPDVRVREAAVRALRAVGTARAVPTLRALSGPPILERAANQAVLDIQARIGVDGGGLALAVDGGGLAVVEPHE